MWGESGCTCPSLAVLITLLTPCCRGAFLVGVLVAAYYIVLVSSTFVIRLDATLTARRTHPDGPPTIHHPDEIVLAGAEATSNAFLLRHGATSVSPLSQYKKNLLNSQ